MYLTEKTARILVIIALALALVFAALISHSATFIHSGYSTTNVLADSNPPGGDDGSGRGGGGGCLIVIADASTLQPAHTC